MAVVTAELPLVAAQILLMALLFIWLWRALKSKKARFYATKLDYALGLFLLLSILSTIVISPYKNVSIIWLQNFAGYAVLFYAALFLLDSEEKIEGIVFAIIAMGVFQAILGFMQYFWLDINRVKGTYFNTNFLSGYLVAVLAIAGGIALFSKGRLKIVVLGAVILLLLGAIVLTQSRGGILSLVAALSVIAGYRFGKKGVACIMVVVALLVVIPNPLSQRIRELPKTDIYAYSRIDIWRNSLVMIRDYPLGVGLGNYLFASSRYRYPTKEAVAHYGKIMESAHNEYLQVGVELGVAGLMIFLWGLWRTGGVIIQSIRSAGTERQKGMIVGMAGGITGIFIHSLVDINLHEPSICMLLVVMVGTILALARDKAGVRERVWCIPVRITHYHYAALSILIFLSAIFTVKPAVAYYFYAYGSQLKQEGKGLEAEKAFERAVFLDAGNMLYTDALADLYFRGYKATGDARLAERALAELDYAESLNPANYRFPYHKGMIHLQLAKKETASQDRGHHLDMAIGNYKRALELLPSYPFAGNEMGEALALQGNVDAAAEAFRQVVEKEPNFLPARVNLAVVCQRLLKKDMAREEYLKVLEIKERLEKRVSMTATEREYLNIDEKIVRRELSILGESADGSTVGTQR